MQQLVHIAVQTVLAFVSILAYARLLGKQQISEMTYYDYINGITFGSIASVMATDTTQQTWQHFVGLSLFVFLTLTVQKIALFNRKARKVLEGNPAMVIQHGKILEKNLGKDSYSLDHLMTQLRRQGVFRVEDVEYGILEINGQLSVLLRADKQPLTPSDIGLWPPEATVRSEVIVDGRLIKRNLKQLKLDEEWLSRTLSVFGVKDVEEVAFMAVDKNGQIYVDKYEDKLPDYIETSES